MSAITALRPCGADACVASIVGFRAILRGAQNPQPPMASLIKNSVARKLSRYFKNISADALSLSFFKGEAALHNLGALAECSYRLAVRPRCATASHNMQLISGSSKLHIL